MIETRVPDRTSSAAGPERSSLTKLDLALAWSAALVLLAAIAVTLGATFAS